MSADSPSTLPARFSVLLQLSALTRSPNPSFSEVERGLHEPPVRLPKLIADALSASAQTLFGHAGLITSTARLSAGQEPHCLPPRAYPQVVSAQTSGPERRSHSRTKVVYVHSPGDKYLAGDSAPACTGSPSVGRLVSEPPGLIHSAGDRPS